MIVTVLLLMRRQLEVGGAAIKLEPRIAKPSPYKNIRGDFRFLALFVHRATNIATRARKLGRLLSWPGYKLPRCFLIAAAAAKAQAESSLRLAKMLTGLASLQEYGRVFRTNKSPLHLFPSLDNAVCLF